MFRGGPEHSGVYPDSASGIYGGVLWRKQTDGAVRASPTVSDGIVFIGSADGHFYALDATTGRERWQFTSGSAVTSSAALAGGRAFFSDAKGTFYALDVGEGRLLWKAQFGADVPRAYELETSEHSATHDIDYFLSSAVVLGDMVVVGGGDGVVYALDAKSGRQRWRFRTEGRVRSSPAISQGVVYAASFDGSLYAIDLNTGSLKWRYDTKGRSLDAADFGFDRKSILSSPAVIDGVVHFGSRDSHLYAVDAAKGTVKWVHDYEDDNMTWAISSPAVRDGVVYMGTADGKFVHALRAADGQELWRFKMPGRVWSSPVLAGSSLYVTNQGGCLHAIDLRSGRENWRFKTRAAVQSSAAVSDGIVYFGSSDGGVYAIRADAHQPVQRAVYWDAEAAKLLVRSDLGPRYEDYARVRDFLGPYRSHR
jgi:eukaryotic-like serine/threonine-protein kinase